VTKTNAPEIIVDLAPVKGVQKVARKPEELAQASAEAMDRAMDTVRAMAERTKKAVESLDAKPDDIEVTFGIKLTAEAGALIAKVGGEAQLEVKLAWKTS
jgi:Trypsin-co-occurring domain 1